MDNDAPQHQPDPERQLQRDIHYQVAATLRNMLPPPIEDTPEALARRDRVAIATVAAMIPCNPAETTLAAHHVAALAHAGDCMRLAVHHAADLKQANQLRAQAARMGREARGYCATLLRLQAARQKREAHDASRESATWTEASVAGLMTQALETMPPAPPAAPAPPPAPPARPAAAARAAAAAPAERAPSPFLPPREYDDWSDEEKRLDRLRAAASRYAVLHTMRVQLIRKLGKLPDNCDFEPPPPEVLQEIITGNHSNLRWADTYEPWTG
jgi:hypothetical protein